MPCSFASAAGRQADESVTTVSDMIEAYAPDQYGRESDDCSLWACQMTGGAIAARAKALMRA